MDTKNVRIILLIILVAVGAGYYWFVRKAPAGITNFEECAAAGYQVVENYPKQCQAPDGKVFVAQSVNLPEIIPGTKSLLYKDSDFGFKIVYPEGSNVRKEGFEGFLRVTADGTPTVGIFLQEALFSGTNLGEAAVAIGVISKPLALANCNKAADMQETSGGTVNINGVEFNSFDAIGAAAGNLYESKTYRTVYKGRCYEIVEMLHSGNIGNYPPGMITEFDKAKFSGILEKIAKTFVFSLRSGLGN